MTGTAGLALLHGRHADLVAVILLDENVRVALNAPGTVDTVAETDPADILGLEKNLVDKTLHSKGKKG
jgi:hypothetical protein